MGTEAKLLKFGRLLVTLRLANGELMGATKRAELESVMADTGEKVETKVGKVNVPQTKRWQHRTQQSNRRK